MKIHIKIPNWMGRNTKIFLATVAIFFLLTTSAYGAYRGHDYYSASKLKDEGNLLLETGNYKASIEKFTLALTKWSPKTLKDSLYEGIATAERLLEVQDEKKDQSSPQENGTEVSETVNPAIPASNDQTQPIVASPQTNVGITAPAPIAQTPDPIPAPTTPPPPVAPTCQKETYEPLGPLVTQIVNINNVIDANESSIQSYYAKKIACKDNPDYSVLKVGLESHNSLVSQCENTNQNTINQISAQVTGYKNQRSGYYNQINSILSAHPECSSLYNELVQAVRAKGGKV